MQLTWALRDACLDFGVRVLYICRTLVNNEITLSLGILAIIKGLSALERSRPASRTKLNLERLQGLSMLIFYPLEYISFFSSPLAPVLKGVSPNDSLKASIWSIRAWGAYVVLHVALLIGEWRELVKTGRALSRGESDADPMAVRKRKQAIAYQMVANVSRLPVILHWYVLIRGSIVLRRDVFSS